MSQMLIRRKLAIATWTNASAGTIFGKIVLNVEKALAYIEKKRQESGQKITITHFVGSAIGKALGEVSDLNGQIVLGCYRPHSSVNLSFLVEIDEGKNLAKAKISDINNKNLVSVAKEISAHVEKLRTHRDVDFNKSMNLVPYLPTWLLRPVLQITGYLTSVLGIRMKSLGLEAYPFGSCIVTSVGMMGIDEGYAPPTPFAHVPIYVAVPKITDEAVVRNGQIVIETQLKLMVTLDHRFIDGAQCGKVAAKVREIFDHPELLD